MNQEDTVSIVKHAIDPVAESISVHEISLDRKTVDFEYRFSNPRCFKSSVVVGSSGSISRMELRLPAVRRAESDVDDVPRCYSVGKIEQKTQAAVRAASFPSSTEVEINSDIDDITHQPHVVCNNPSLLPGVIAPSLTTLPDEYIRRVPEEHHVFDNTK